MTYQHGKVGARVVESFVVEDLGAPFKVVLKNCVRETVDEAGAVTGYNIPDYRGLERSIVLTRATLSKKLSGVELKFIRKLLGVKARELAASVELSPEHISHVENGRAVLSPGSEKLARLYLVKTAIKLHKLDACEARSKLERALDSIFDALTPVSACDADHELVLEFSRVSASNLNPANDTGFDGWSDAPRTACQ